MQMQHVGSAHTAHIILQFWQLLGPPEFQKEGNASFCIQKEMQNSVMALARLIQKLQANCLSADLTFRDALISTQHTQDLLPGSFRGPPKR